SAARATTMTTRSRRAPPSRPTSASWTPRCCARSAATTRRCAAVRTGSSTTACAPPDPAWCDPPRRVRHCPRAGSGALVRQFWATGVWRGELVRRLGARNSLRYFAPPLFVLDLVLCIVLAPFLATGLVHGWPAWALSLVYLGPILYLLLLAVAALRSP